MAAPNTPPTLTTFAAVVQNTPEDTEAQVTFANLRAQGDEADIDGTVTAFIVKSVSSGTLRIGLDSTVATAWSIGGNDVINSSNKAFWTPALNDNGLAVNAFMVVARDNNGAQSALPAVQVTLKVNPVNDAPTLTMFSNPVETALEDTEKKITFSDLTAQGDENDVDGTVKAFQVTSVTSGTLRIGIDAVSATAWHVTENALIDSNNKAFWTPAPNTSGSGLDAFTVLAVDNKDLASVAPAVQVKLDVTSVNDAPTLTDFARPVDRAIEDTQNKITFAELMAEGNQADIDGIVVGFIVTNLNSGTLRIGLNADTAEPWDFETGNVLIDATRKAFWTPDPDANGRTNAFKVVALDDGGATSDTRVQVKVNVADVNDAPTFTGLDATPSYTGGTAAVVLDNNATVHDTELSALSLGAGNYGGAVLTIARSGGADAGDAFVGSSNLTLTGGNVTLGSSVIGTDTNAGGSLAITFASGTTEAQVNEVLQKIAYSYTGLAFGTTASLAFSLSDGNAGSQGSGGPLIATGSVSVSLVAGAPVMSGGSSGNDNLVGMSYSNTLNGLAGDDTLTGNIGPDRLNGGSGNDTMTGGDGDDVYVVDSNGDMVNEGSGAGSGTDTVESQLTTYVLGANLENLTYVGALSFTGTGNSANNTIIGGSSNDTLAGGDGNDIIYGNAGLDTLNGGTGNDKLYGGLGNDVLIGGTGNDEYYFDTALSLTNVDRINDFSALDDTIYLSSAIFGAAGQAGQLAASAFGTGSYATTSAQRIIFNTVDKTVSYDADGSGSGAAVRFVALLGTTGTVTAADFWVY